MPLAMKQIDGYDCPHVVCEVCRRAVTGDGGMVVWDEENHSRVFFLHVGECWLAWEAAHPGKVWPFYPLPAFMVYLWNNAGIKRRAAEEQARLLASIG